MSENSNTYINATDKQSTNIIDYYIKNKKKDEQLRLLCIRS